MSGTNERVVVVTGGARGIGDAIIRAFVREGARAVSIDLGEPEDAIDGVRYLSGNVGDREQMEALFADIGASEGRIDVMVNNAGIQRVGLTETFDPDVWRQVVEVHLFGMFNCTALALPFMKRQGSGVILSMASTTAIVGVPGRGPYTASKGAISAWTRSLAVEVAEAGIRVNAVAPGTIATELAAKAVLTSDDAKQRILGRTPMKRLGEPREIADAVAYLASDAASYVTGEILVVDGGRMALNYTVPV